MPYGLFVTACHFVIFVYNTQRRHEQSAVGSSMEGCRGQDELDEAR